jgi:hypothetical protein
MSSILYIYLVGGLEHFLNVIIPTDFHIFQRGKYTTNQPLTSSIYDITTRNSTVKWELFPPYIQWFDIPEIPAIFSSAARPGIHAGHPAATL